MAVDREPAWLVESAGADRALAWADLGAVRHGGAAARAETHAQPAAAFVGAVLALGQFTLQQRHLVFVESRQHGKGAGQAALAEAAVAHRAQHRRALDAVAHREAVLEGLEMHVGGAALDGYLALAVPFAVHAVLRAPDRLRWAR